MKLIMENWEKFLESQVEAASDLQEDNGDDEAEGEEELEGRDAKVDNYVHLYRVADDRIQAEFYKSEDRARAALGGEPWGGLEWEMVAKIIATEAKEEEKATADEPSKGGGWSGEWIVTSPDGWVEHIKAATAADAVANANAAAKHPGQVFTVQDKAKREHKMQVRAPD